MNIRAPIPAGGDLPAAEAVTPAILKTIGHGSTQKVEEPNWPSETTAVQQLGQGQAQVGQVVEGCLKRFRKDE
jgi:hypothetical protein